MSILKEKKINRIFKTLIFVFVLSVSVMTTTTLVEAGKCCSSDTVGNGVGCGCTADKTTGFWSKSSPYCWYLDPWRYCGGHNITNSQATDTGNVKDSQDWGADYCIGGNVYFHRTHGYRIYCSYRKCGWLPDAVYTDYGSYWTSNPSNHTGWGYRDNGDVPSGSFNNSGGTHLRYCTGCGAGIANEAHTYGAVQTNGYGYRYRQCTACGHIFYYGSHYYFDLNGGSVYAPTQYNRPYTGVTTLPANPTRAGYEFAGWQLKAVTNGWGNPCNIATVNSQTDPLQSGSAVRYWGGTNVYTSWFSSDPCCNVFFVATWAHKHESVTSTGLTTSVTDGYVVEQPYGYDVLNGTDSSRSYNSFYVKGTDNNNVSMNYTYKHSNNTKYWVYGNYFRWRYPNNNWNGWDGKTTGKWLADQTYNHIVAEGYCVGTCHWCDNYHGYCNATAYSGITKRLVGDSVSPTFVGDNNFNNMMKLTALDKSEISSYVIGLSANDNDCSVKPYNYLTCSGLKDTYIEVKNKDNSKIVKFNHFVDTPSYGKIIVKQLSDIVNLVQLDDLFAGNYSITIYAEDMVGNVSTKTFNMGTFDMDLELTSHTYKPNTNYKNGKVLFKQGEAGNLKVTTYGYANALKVQFPSDWYVSNDNPLYMYWGDPNNYDESKLETITQDCFYIKKTSPEKIWEQNFIFLTPTKTTADLKNINVTAYKGEVDVINNSQIIVNENAGENLKTLSRDVPFIMSETRIFDDLHTTIDKTYRNSGTR